MDFSPYQQKERFSNPNANYTDPLRVHADHSGGLALAKQDAKNVGVFINGVLAYKEKVDSAKSMEANNEYNRLMSEGTAELMQRKQEKALNIVDEYDKLQAKVLERVQKQYKSYIGYGDAAVAFNNYTTKDNATRRENMLKYQLAETDAYHETQYNNQLAQCRQDALDGGASDEAINGALARMNVTVDSRFMDFGGEKTQEQKRIVGSQIVGDALNFMIGTGDYNRAGEILENYRGLISSDSYIRAKTTIQKAQEKQREHEAIGRISANYRDANGRIDLKRAYAEIDKICGRGSTRPGTGEYVGSHQDIWREAKWVESQTGVPAEFIYKQWGYETRYDGELFNSPLARENLNFGGLTQEEPNGEDNRQPEEGATNYYREFGSLHEYAEAYVNDFLKYYDLSGVNTLEDFISVLKENDYFESPYEKYLSGVQSIEVELDADSVESAFDYEKQARMKREVEAAYQSEEAGRKRDHAAYRENFMNALDGAQTYADGVEMIENADDLNIQEKNKAKRALAAKFDVKIDGTPKGSSARAEEKAYVEEVMYQMQEAGDFETARQIALDSGLSMTQINKLVNAANTFYNGRTSGRMNTNGRPYNPKKDEDNLDAISIKLMNGTNPTAKEWVKMNRSAHALIDSGMLPDDAKYDLYEFLQPNSQAMGDLTDFLDAGHDIREAYMLLTGSGVDSRVAIMLLSMVDDSYKQLGKMEPLGDDDDDLYDDIEEEEKSPWWKIW